MAKKRRRGGNRTHAQSTSRGAVGTAERSAEEPVAGGRAQAQARPGGPQRTRAEKKELARKQRDEVRRRIRRVQRARQLVWVTGVLAVVFIGAALLFKPDEPAVRPDRLPGELRTADAPWPANSGQAAARAESIGLPAEGTTMHTHADVQMFVHGQQEDVPQDIGILDTGATAIHTHTGDGVVHMESASVHEFTLGEFFDVWGVRLSGTCLGGYCESGADLLQVFKDGQDVTGSIRGVVLDDQSVIVVTFGTPDELPNPIPSTFDFGSITP